jgi:hypothetical protein
MLNSQSLHLDSPDSVSFKLHPIVIMSILDQFKRRAEDQTYVIGTLMGQRRGAFVEITNCFPVNCILSDTFASMDMVHMSNFVTMLHKTNPDEYVIGWSFLFY